MLELSITPAKLVKLCLRPPNIAATGTGRTASIYARVMDDLPPVLVVEDEPLVRLTMVESLKEGGYTVVEADTGPAALEAIDQAEQLRGLVTDIRMGAGPNGWDVAHAAREKFPALPVVYVTGDSVAQWSANGVPLSTVLQKPFADAELVTALANLLVAQQSGTPPC